MKVYKHSDICPIWNFYQVEKTSDLRHLMILERHEYFDLPEINSDQFQILSLAYDAIVYSISSDVYDLRLINAKFEAWDAFVGYIANRPDHNYNKYFAKYKLHINNTYSDFIITDNTLLRLQEDIAKRFIDKLTE